MSRWAARCRLQIFDQMREAIAEGFPSFKVFTNEALPPHPQRPPFKLDFGRIELAMERAARHGGIMVVHAEDDDLVQFNYERFRAEGRTDGANLHLVHSKLSEQLAFKRTIQLAQATGAGGLLRPYLGARRRRSGGRGARASTCRFMPKRCIITLVSRPPNTNQPRGFCYHTYPSLKLPDDQEALWEGLVRDGVSTTATDEYPTSLEVKLRGKNIDDVTGGNLGAEARMGIVYTEGVVRRGMSLQRFADVTSTNAARILGLYPHKGASRRAATPTSP